MQACEEVKYEHNRFNNAGMWIVDNISIFSYVVGRQK
ncbi:MAG: hypothetical protein [Podoviridae sp. cty5g4]|nr:MAG: hypothetical protein [Podoviridae sp. cty5g4]